MIEEVIIIPWMITVALDEGREDIGLLTAFYTEEGKENFIFSLRSDISQKSQDKFLECAQIELSKRLTKKSKEQLISSNMTISANKVSKG